MGQRTCPEIEVQNLSMENCQHHTRMTWLKKLFGIHSLKTPEPYGINLTRQRIEDMKFPSQGCMGGYNVWDNFNTYIHKLHQYKYWCSCGTELTDGPTGGCAVNAVCEHCRVNYGCLPGYLGH